MNDKTIQQDVVVKSFIEKVVPVIKKDITPTKILIFGSRVRGESRKDSDLDVIIVSDFFKGIKFVKRMTAVLKKIRFSKHVDIICYTPEEFEKIQSSSTVIKNAVEEGIVV